MITTNIRATINEGQNINQGRDFSHLGAGNVTNIQGFLDDLSMLELIENNTRNLNITSGYSFVRYEKNSVEAFMKCELTTTYNQPFIDTDGVYFLFVELDAGVIVTGSTQASGADYFSIKRDTALPVSGYFLPLYQFEVSGSDVSIVEDFRKKRDVVFQNIQIDENLNVNGDINADNITANIVTTQELILPDGNIQDQIDDILSQGIPTEHIVDLDTYITGEGVLQGESLFVEDMIAFADATTLQSVGQNTATTRIAIQAIGSGVSGNAIKLSLRKFVSPSVNLGIRVETDNSGQPSGVLIDPNATASVSEAILTTTLQDITATFAGSFMIPKGERVHVVLFAGTYGSETINATNYFAFGVKDLHNTTTRQFTTFNGSVRSGFVLGLDVTDGHGAGVSGSASGVTDPFGFRATATKNLFVKEVIKFGTLTGANLRLLVRDAAGTILASTTALTGNTFTLPSPVYFAQGSLIRFEIDNSGGTYTARTFINLPNTGTNLTRDGTAGSTAGMNSGVPANVQQVVTQSIDFLATNMAYMLGSVFEQKLLSKTNATFPYKLPTDLPRIATESSASGQKCIATTFGINRFQAGIVPLTSYRVANTAGAISSSPGTNQYILGYGISNDKVFVNHETQYVVAGTANTVANLPAVKNAVVSVRTLQKQTRVPKPGIYRIAWNSNNGVGNTTQMQIYRNGIPYGPIISQATAGAASWSQDLYFSAKDLIQLWTFKNTINSSSVSNFVVSNTIPLLAIVGTDNIN